MVNSQVFSGNAITAAKANEITVGDTAPANPTLGWIWIDTTTTPSQIKGWSGTGWVVVALGPGIFTTNGDLLVGTGAGAVNRLGAPNPDAGDINILVVDPGRSLRWTQPFSIAFPTLIKLGNLAATAGTSNQFSRRDHVHAFPVSGGQALQEGDLFYSSLGDLERLPLGAPGQILGVPTGFAVPTWRDLYNDAVPPQSVALGKASSTGVDIIAARRDHVHPVDIAARTGNGSGVNSINIDVTLVPGRTTTTALRVWFNLERMPRTTLGDFTMTINGVSTGYVYDAVYRQSDTTAEQSAVAHRQADTAFILNHKVPGVSGENVGTVLVDMWQIGGFAYVHWSLWHGIGRVAGSGVVPIAGPITALRFGWVNQSAYSYRIVAE